MKEYDCSICPVCGSTNTEETARHFDEQPKSRHELVAVTVYCFDCRKSSIIDVAEQSEVTYKKFYN